MPVKRKAATRKPRAPKRTEHRVAATVLQELELAKRGFSLCFVVRRGRTKVGKLQIGQGSVIWESARTKTRNTRLSWSQFVKAMEQHARYE